jgi:hypothetical protein
VALHLTLPPVEIPDREALGIPSHLAAARGAYVLRDYDLERVARDGNDRAVELNMIVMPAHQWSLVYEWEAD